MVKNTLKRSLWLNIISIYSIFCFYSCKPPAPDDTYFGLDIQWSSPIVDGAVLYKGVLNNFNGDEADLEWTWSFGDDPNYQVDEYRSFLRNPYYQYSRYGDFTVSLKVKEVSSGKSQTVSKPIYIRYFSDIPFASVVRIDTNIFGFSLRGFTYKGQKYEYTDPNPEFRLEISTTPSFDTLIPINGIKKYIDLPFDAPYITSIERLMPDTDYFVRIKTIRYSSFKQNIIQDVSQAITNIIEIRTLPLPDINISVDTTTNAELIIINADLPGLLVDKKDSKLTIYKDDNFDVPYTGLEAYAGDTIYYREPGSKLTFRYEFIYTHPTLDITLNRVNQVDINTPNVLFQFDDVILRSEDMFNLPTRNTSFNNKREISFQGLGVSIAWNRSPDDNGTRLTIDEFGSDSYRSFGVPFRQPVVGSDFHSYLVYAVNSISYFHDASANHSVAEADFGNMVIYDEDDEFIYCRMSLPLVGNIYREGYEMVVVTSTGSQQSLRKVYLKGFVFKLRKKL